MPIFNCQSDFFRNPRRVYPSRKTILNCFARQSTTCPYSVVNTTKGTAPRIKRHRSQYQRKLNVSVDYCSPLHFTSFRVVALLGLHHMPIFSCQSDFFRNPRRVYPSRKTILNCFARQSTTCPYSVVNTTKGLPLLCCQRISFKILTAIMIIEKLITVKISIQMTGTLVISFNFFQLWHRGFANIHAIFTSRIESAADNILVNSRRLTFNSFQRFSSHRRQRR